MANIFNEITPQRQSIRDLEPGQFVILSHGKKVCNVNVHGCPITQMVSNERSISPYQYMTKHTNHGRVVVLCFKEPEDGI